jgi:hypothetical protein
MARNARPIAPCGLYGLTGCDHRKACSECLAELRDMSAQLTTQVLTLLPMQVLLAAGVAVVVKSRAGDDLVTVAALISVTLAILFSVYALRRVHHQAVWESGTDDGRRDFVLGEAQKVYDKGRWTRRGVGMTLAAGLFVVWANLAALDG